MTGRARSVVSRLGWNRIISAKAAPFQFQAKAPRSHIQRHLYYCQLLMLSSHSSVHPTPIYKPFTVNGYHLFTGNSQLQSVPALTTVHCSPPHPSKAHRIPPHITEAHYNPLQPTAACWELGGVPGDRANGSGGRWSRQLHHSHPLAYLWGRSQMRRPYLPETLPIRLLTTAGVGVG